MIKDGKRRSVKKTKRQQKAIKGDKRRIKSTENEHFLMKYVKCVKKNVI